MFRGLIDTVIGNLRLSITNVHIRYEVWLDLSLIYNLHTSGNDGMSDASRKLSRAARACPSLLAC